MIWRGLLLSCMWLASSALAASPPASGQTGLLRDVVVTDYTSLSSSAELLRRLVSPLNSRRLQQRVATTGMAIREQPIDLAKERFALYVPNQMPPNGYALLVFVPPWNDAVVPSSWITRLERQGVILVTAANIGNDTNLLDRREPLALLAAYNVMSRYRVDPQRVYVGGLSGGSRVAERLALGYPDIFRGALLEAGSDVVGGTIPLPPRELLDHFQTSTRVVYLTGERDATNLDTDNHSRQSLKRWCVTDIDSLNMPWTGHELADAGSLERALASLDKHRSSDPSELAACRARIDRELSSQLDQVEALVAAGKASESSQLLEKIDTHYGGLAAPRSVTLATAMGGSP